MGFNFTAFAGGFAGALAEDIEKEEKLAEARAINGVKNMAETYKTMLVDNRKLKEGLVENINALRTYDPTATEQELFEIAKSKPLMELITAKVKSGEYTSDTMKLSHFATVQKNNSNATAMQLADDLFNVPKVVEEQRYRQETAKTGNIFRDMIAGAGDKAAERAARQTASAMGMSLEQLQAAKNYTTPTLTSTATANMKAFEKPKTFDKLVDDAKIRMVIASKTGNADAFNEARADVALYTGIIDKMSPAQTQFANKVASIKTRYMFGTPEERAAAKPEYDKLLADVRAEAAAKKTGDGDDKIPALGTLNSFTSSAVARKVAQVHGDLIKDKHLAIIKNIDGSASLEYTGGNLDILAKINNTAYDAAKNALSLYMTPKGEPMTRDVAAVLNSYIPQSAPVTPLAPAATKQAVPTPTHNVNALRKDAEVAIARGADRTAVAKRFKDQTGQEL